MRVITARATEEPERTFGLDPRCWRHDELAGGQPPPWDELTRVSTDDDDEVDDRDQVAGGGGIAIGGPAGIYRCVEDPGVACHATPSQTASRSDGPNCGDELEVRAIVAGTARDGSSLPYLELADGSGFCASTLPGSAPLFELVWMQAVAEEWLRVPRFEAMADSALPRVMSALEEARTHWPCDGKDSDSDSDEDDDEFDRRSRARSLAGSRSRSRTRSLSHSRSRSRSSSRSFTDDADLRL